MAARKKSNKAASLDDLVGEIEDVLIDIDHPVFTSGVVCDLLEVTPWFLKQLDDEGLVSPPRETENSTRFYSKNELNKVAYITKLMTESNLNIDGVKLVFQLQGESLE